MKRATCTDFVAKSGTKLYSPQERFRATCNGTTRFVQDRFDSWVENVQHRYSTRFAAMLQNKLHVFAACFTVLLALGKMAHDVSPYAKTKKDKQRRATRQI